MKNLSILISFLLFNLFVFQGFAQINPNIKPVLKNKKIEINKPIIDKHSKLFRSKDIIMQRFSINMSAATKRGTGNNAIYTAPFQIIVKNNGLAKTGLFYLCTYVNDYSHPHSGDSWWARETQLTEKIKIVTARGTGVSRKNYNTIKMANLNGGQRTVIRGTLQVREKHIGRYHITAVADCNNAATSYYSSHGNVKETDEFNNKKGIIPRN